jgi:hypothetical protein
LRSRVVYTDPLSPKVEWRKVQYKSTPYREGAVWFRDERGNCFVSHRKKSRETCYKKNAKIAKVIAAKKNKYREHAAIAFLESEHPRFYEYELIKKLRITDYRYRIVFSDDNDNEIFELSLDTYTKEDLVDGTRSKHFEVELEILAENSTKQTLDDLFEMASIIERSFAISPSETTKSGVFVGQ